MMGPHVDPRPTVPDAAQLATHRAERERVAEHVVALWCDIFGRRRCPGYVRPVLVQWGMEHGVALVETWLTMCAARCRGRRARVRLAYLQRLRDSWVGGGR